MKVTTVGLDLAKSVFTVQGVDELGKMVLRKTVRRARLLELFALTLPRFHVHQNVGKFLMDGGRDGKEGDGSKSAVHGGVQDRGG